MTTDLWMAAAAIGLCWAQILVAATPQLLHSLPWGFGNRDTPPPVDTPWTGRANRAAQNMKENLPLFVGLVVIVHVSGSADGTSALGSMIFVGARVAHAILYTAGIPVARTLAWVVSIAGMFMVAYALA